MDDDVELPGSSEFQLDDSRDLGDIFPDVKGPEMEKSSYLSEPIVIRVAMPEAAPSENEAMEKTAKLPKTQAEEKAEQRDAVVAEATAKAEQALAEQQAAAAAAAAATRALEEDNVTLVEELDRAQERLKEVQGQCSDLKLKVKELEQEVTRQKASTDMMISKAGKVDGLTEEQGALQKALDASQAEVLALTKQVESVNLQKDALDTEVKKSKHDYGVLNAEVVVLRRTADAVAATTQKAVELEATCSRQQEALQQAAGQAKELAELRDQVLQMDRLRARVQQLERENEDMSRRVTSQSNAGDETVQRRLFLLEEQLWDAQRENRALRASSNGGPGGRYEHALVGVGSNIGGMPPVSHPNGYGHGHGHGHGFVSAGAPPPAPVSVPAPSGGSGAESEMAPAQLQHAVHQVHSGRLEQAGGRRQTLGPTTLNLKSFSPEQRSVRASLGGVEHGSARLHHVYPSPQNHNHSQQQQPSPQSLAAFTNANVPRVPSQTNASSASTQEDPVAGDSSSGSDRMQHAEARASNRQGAMNSNSLAAALQGNKAGAASAPANERRRRSFANTPAQREHTPFATESTAAELESFEALDRELTSLMTEKKDLDEEQARLHQRGGKTLKERTRLKQVEARLLVVGREVSGLRRQLALKPG